MQNLLSIPKTSGIYQIMHVTTGTIYIGSSVDMYSRTSYHRSSLRRGDHHSAYLQRAWNKYGEEQFRVDVVLLCDKSDLAFQERYFITNLYPEFNMNRFTSRPEHSTISDERRRAMSLQGKKNWLDPNFRIKHKEGWARIMSEPYTSDKMRASRMRVIRERPELAEQHSECMKEKFKDPAYLQRHIEITTAAKQDPLFKENMSKSIKDKWRDPGYCKHLRHLSDDEVISVLKMRLDGVSCKQIAEQFNCSVHVIKDISRGKSYKHINRETLEVDPDFYIQKV